MSESMRIFGSRSRTCSESSEGGEMGRTPPAGGFLAGLAGKGVVGYDLEGKFTYNQVLKSNKGNPAKTTVDENGKFSYVSSDMRPVPPGWYDVDKTKHKVPIGWYDLSQKKP